MPTPVFTPAFKRQTLSAFSLTILLVLCGCGMGTKAPSAGGLGVSGGDLKGRAYGGQQPITGASVYLYAASSSGYGSAPTSLLCGASTTVTCSDPGTSSTVQADGNNNGYVVTDASGNFNITGDWDTTCGGNPIAQVYIVAQGGNPGLATGTDNPGIALMAALGECDNVVTNYPFIDINEVTTVASVWALQQFMADAAPLSSSSTNIGSSGTNTLGLINAFQQVPNIVDIATGTVQTNTSGGNGSIPHTEIYTLADILAYCINSGGTSGGSPGLTDTSANCNTLFTDATPATTPATTPPTDIIQAALLIARNPTNNVSTLLGHTSGTSPFQDKFAIASPPNDWSIAIQYTGAGMLSPEGIAADGNGNVWITNTQPDGSSIYRISVLNTTGQDVTSPAGGYASILNDPFYIAFDTNDTVWISSSIGTTNINSQQIYVTAMDQFGDDITSGVGYPANVIQGIGGMGPDGNANMWLTSGTGAGNALFQFNTATSGGFVGYASPTNLSNPASGLINPNGVAVYTNGTIWVADEGTNPASDAGNMDIFSSSSGLNETGPIVPTNLDGPVAVVLDASGFAWIPNASGAPDGNVANISVVDSSGDDETGTNGLTAGFTSIQSIAIDGYDNLWILDGANPNRLEELSGFNSSAIGTVMTGSTGLQSSYITGGTQSMALDPSGNIWITEQPGGSGTASAVVFLGVAGPVDAPLASTIQSGLLGQLP